MVALRHFRYLTALACETHFGRAARRCNVSQPTLSAMFTLARGLDIQSRMDTADFARPSEFIAKAG